MYRPVDERTRQLQAPSTALVTKHAEDPVQDLANERKRASFSSQELCYFLNGGKEKVERRWGLELAWTWGCCMVLLCVVADVCITVAHGEQNRQLCCSDAYKCTVGPIAAMGCRHVVMMPSCKLCSLKAAGERSRSNSYSTYSTCMHHTSYAQLSRHAWKWSATAAAASISRE